MKTSQALGILIITFSNLTWLSNGSATGEPTAMELNDALKHYRSIKSQTLQDPKNARLLQQLRIKARDEGGVTARILLLRMGDETVVQACLERLRSPRGTSARREFVSAGNP